MTYKNLSKKVLNYYDQHIQEHGFSAKGMGWKDDVAQQDRFKELIKIIDKPVFTINDLGCGTGVFYDFLITAGYQSFLYRGYDILEKMIEYAIKIHRDIPAVSFKRINDPKEMETADYCVASGIFSLKYDCNDEDWIKYIIDTLSEMNKHSLSGFAFNMLTKYSDPDKLNTDLFYADPLFIFDHCVRNFSRKVAVLHDYEQYDFTILVKK